MNTPKLPTGLLAAALTVLGLAACGGEDSPGGAERPSSDPVREQSASSPASKPRADTEAEKRGTAAGGQKAAARRQRARRQRARRERARRKARRARANLPKGRTSPYPPGYVSPDVPPPPPRKNGRTPIPPNAVPPAQSLPKQSERR